MTEKEPEIATNQVSQSGIPTLDIEMFKISEETKLSLRVMTEVLHQERPFGDIKSFTLRLL